MFHGTHLAQAGILLRSCSWVHFDIVTKKEHVLIGSTTTFYKQLSWEAAILKHGLKIWEPKELHLWGDEIMNAWNMKAHVFGV